MEQQYFEAVEETMVDAAQIFASLAELGVSETGEIDTEVLKKTFTKARRREFSAQIYGHLKKSVTMHVYIIKADGMVIYDSNGGRMEGQDYSEFNDFIRTMEGRLRRALVEIG